MTTKKALASTTILLLSLPVLAQTNMGDGVKESPTSGAITMSPGFQDNTRPADQQGTRADKRARKPKTGRWNTGPSNEPAPGSVPESTAPKPNTTGSDSAPSEGNGN